MADVVGQNGRKLTASGRARAERLEAMGCPELDDPGRPGRPLSLATIMAAKNNRSTRTGRRHLAAARHLITRFEVHPSALNGTSLNKPSERQALTKLPNRDSARLIAAAMKGKRVSAKLRLERLKSPKQKVWEEVEALIRLFNRSSPAARAEFQHLLSASTASSQP